MKDPLFQPLKLISTKSEVPSTELADRSKWMTATEAAAYLRTTVGAIRNLVYRGAVPRYKLGRRLLFKHADLDRLIESSRKGGHCGH